MSGSSWWNRFGQEWATQGVTDDPTNAQADAGWAFIGQAPPTVEQFNSMFQWNDDKDNWLYGQIANVITDGGLALSETDLTLLLQALNKRQKVKLATNLTLFVDALNGNDTTADGSSGLPFRTVQAAISYSYAHIDPAGNGVIIQLKTPATYEPFSTDRNFGGPIFVQGDILNSRSYIIKNTNGTAVAASGASSLVIRGLSLEASGTDIAYGPAGVGCWAGSGAYLLYENIAFGPCSNRHMWISTGGNFYPYMRLGPTQIPTYSLYGNAPQHMLAVNAGNITIVNANITLTTTLTFSSAFAQADSGGYIQGWGSTTITQTAVGTRYIVSNNGVINNSGKGVNLFPGTIAGVTQTGGQYDA